MGRVIGPDGGVLGVLMGDWFYSSVGRCSYPVNLPRVVFNQNNPIGWESLDCTGPAYVRQDYVETQNFTGQGRASGKCVAATVPAPEGLAMYRFSYPVRLQSVTIASRMTTGSSPTCATLASPIAEQEFPLEKVPFAEVTVFDTNFTGWSLDP